MRNMSFMLTTEQIRNRTKAKLAAEARGRAPQTTLPLCVNDTCLYSCADDECKKAAEKGIPWPAPQTDVALEALLKEGDRLAIDLAGDGDVLRADVVDRLRAALRQLLSDQSATDKAAFKACVSGYIAGVQDYRDDSVDAVQLRLNAIQEASLQFPSTPRAGTVQPQEHAKATSVGAASHIDLSATEEAAFKADREAKLVRALRNCYTSARRKASRDFTSQYSHIVRFCEEVDVDGDICGTSILRDSPVEEPQHVCGLQGFGRGIGGLDDVCPACRARQSKAGSVK